MDIAGKKVAYLTLGCKLNFSETSTIRHSLEAAGTITVGDKGEADIFVVNTCSVTDVAEKKGRQLIRKIVAHHPGAYVVVVGCYAQLRAGEILGIEGVNLVLGAGDKFNVEHYLRHLEAEERHEPHACDVFKLADFDLAYSFGDRTRCFLKIQDGCDYFCTYCTIPYARGRSRSASVARVLEAVRDVASRGVREVILTGVNTGDFGRGTGERFIDLLRQLDTLDDIERYRISSIEPNLLTDEIIDFVAGSRHFMPHFHVPLQSGSNEVLKLMRRRYDRELFAAKMEKIKAAMPDAFIGVDVIVGTRGETSDYFEQAYQFIDGLDVTQLHVFSYSERPGTQALKIDYVVSPEEKHQRSQRLLALSDEKTQAFYARHIGQVMPVLMEKSKAGTPMHGFTENYIRVEVESDDSLDNQVVHVRLGEFNEEMTALKGTILV